MSDTHATVRAGAAPAYYLGRPASAWRRALGSGDDADGKVRFLRQLLEANATIAGDVAEVDVHAWAIHGSIAVDGEVIMAEFTSRDEAVAVLSRLP